jgi:hypothetical protein
MNISPLIKISATFFVFFVSAVHATAPSVASVTLAVGDVKRITGQGTAAPLATGAFIAEGDHIITGNNAVAVLVFTDEGRISLRANTELVVKHYKIDPTGADTLLEFELVRGAVRQISGQAARKQPERYRLNTPIATIGVRGTDFLAKTSANALETYIQEGKIVVLPSLSACSGQAQTGTCAPFASISAADEARYLKVSQGGILERRTLGGADVERLFGLGQIKVLAPAAPTPSVQASPLPPKGPESTRTPENSPLSAAAPEAWAANVREVTATENNAQITFIAFNKSLDDVGLKADEKATTTTTTALVAPPAVAPAPVPVPAPALPATQQLVWGKFSYAEQLPLQLLVPYATASEGRSVTVGAIGQHALWRTAGGPDVSPSLKGEVQFAMHSGEAYLQQGTQLLPAAITNPALSINFDKATFNSSLTLTQAQTGSVPLQVSGNINAEGVFVGVAPGQRVAGAISYDGKEAGFLFNRDNALGVFKGITLWNSR